MGRVLAELERLGLTDDTAVFFTSDHGAFVGSHKMQDKGPAMYDDTYRMPLIASLPGGAQARRGRALRLAGRSAGHLPGPGRARQCLTTIDGRSLVPLLRGEDAPDWRQHIVAEFHGHHFPYPQRMIRTHTHKLVVNPPDIDELYDLANDPYELVNQIDNPAYAEVKRSLIRRPLPRACKRRGDNFYHWMTTMYDVGAGSGRRLAERFPALSGASRSGRHSCADRNPLRTRRIGRPILAR